MDRGREDTTGVTPMDPGAAVKNAFLSRINHELRTPISAILGMTRMAFDAAAPEKVTYCLTQIERSATHLLDLVNNMLDMSRLSQGQLNLSPELFDIERMVMELLAPLLPLSAEKMQTLRVRLDPQMPRYFTGDRARVGQIITGLLGNAIKFTPERGHITLAIAQLSRENNTSALQISVRDDGIGIAPEKHAALFEPFEQGDGSISRNYGGTGLGLSVCRSLARLMGGDIVFESRPGEGALFVCTLSLVSNEEKLVTRASPEEFENLRLLVACADPETGDICGELAAALGVGFETAGTKEACLEALSRAAAENRPFDLVLLDETLPGGDGIQAEMLVPNAVILTTHGKSPDSRFLNGQSAPVRFLVKPILPGGLLTCLRHAAGITQPHPPAFSDQPLKPSAGVSHIIKQESLYEPSVYADFPFVADEDIVLFIDKADALARVRGNRLVYRALLMSFLRNTYFSQLTHELERGDKSSALRTIHALGGLAANLSLPAVHDRVTLLETQVKNGIDPSETLEDLSAALQKTLACVDRVLDSL